MIKVAYYSLNCTGRCDLRPSFALILTHMYCLSYFLRLNQTLGKIQAFLSPSLLIHIVLKCINLFIIENLETMKTPLLYNK